MQPNTAAVAQIGNLLTSPVFLTAFSTLAAGFAALWNAHFDPASAAFVPSLVAMMGAAGTILAHWGTAAVSISSTTMLPARPLPLPPGTHTVMVQGDPVTAQLPPAPISVALNTTLHPAAIRQ